MCVCAEGVCYAEKDFNLAKHPEIDVPNLQVIKLMQSFKSKELVTERFAWRHYYWCGFATLCWHHRSRGGFAPYQPPVPVQRTCQILPKGRSRAP